MNEECQVVSVTTVTVIDHRDNPSSLYSYKSSIDPLVSTGGQL